MTEPGLPTNIQPNDAGHIPHHDELHDLLRSLAMQSGPPAPFFAPGYSQGPLSARPAPIDSRMGWRYFDTDINREFLFDGTTWQNVAEPPNSPFFFASDYGAVGPSESAGTNVTTIQAACDAAEAAGGGTVIMPRGILQAGGLHIQLGHGVILDGLGATTLVQSQPNQSSFNDATSFLVDTKRYTTTGTMSNGSYDITVGSAVNARIGAAIAVNNANRELGPNNFIAAQRVLFAQIIGITGNVLHLDKPCSNPSGVTTSPVTIGPYRPGIVRLTLDGASTRSGNPNGDFMCVLRLWLASKALVADSVVLNSDQAGIFLTDGCIDCNIDNNELRDCGAPARPGGQAIFLFGGCDRNFVTNNRILGRWHRGIFIDSGHAPNANDWPSNDNLVFGNSLVRSEIVGGMDAVSSIQVESSDRNKVFANSIVDIVGSGAGAGILLNTGQDNRGCNENIVALNNIVNSPGSAVRLNPPSNNSPSLPPATTNPTFRGNQILQNVADSPLGYLVEIPDATHPEYPNANDNVIMGNAVINPGLTSPTGSNNPVRPGAGSNIIMGNFYETDESFFLLSPLRLLPVATTALPVGGTTVNGRIAVEDGTGGQNLVYYANGNRYRITGVSF